MPMYMLLGVSLGPLLLGMKGAANNWVLHGAWKATYCDGPAWSSQPKLLDAQ